MNEEQQHHTIVHEYHLKYRRSDLIVKNLEVWLFVATHLQKMLV
jgi:hypothetical protein